MIRFWNWLAAFGFAFAMIAGPMSATAQIIQLGGSDAEVKAMLSQQGYDRIDIVDRGLSSTTYQACFGQDRVQFKHYWDGRIGGMRKIGGCRVLIGEAEVAQLLRQRGYERINIEDHGGNYVAIACRNGDRYRINVTQQGDIRRERQIGQCQNELSPTDIAALLERDGYDRIRFTDRQLPRYVAEACDRNQKVELVLNRFGEIRSRREIGQCEQPINPSDIPRLLAERGWSRVSVTDARLPRYKAEGCRDGLRIEVTLNRYGSITDEVRIGQCRDELSARQLRVLLEQMGYSQIEVTDNGRNGYLALVCRGNDRSELILTRYGEVQRENRLGGCTARTTTEISEWLRARGYDNIQLQVEACDGATRYVIRLNEFGEAIDRRRTGRC